MAVCPAGPVVKSFEGRCARRPRARRARGERRTALAAPRARAIYLLPTLPYMIFRRRRLVLFALVIVVGVATYTYSSLLSTINLDVKPMFLPDKSVASGLQVGSPESTDMKGLRQASNSSLEAQPLLPPSASLPIALQTPEGLPIGAYLESCEGCDVLRFEEFGEGSSSEGRAILRCSQCEDYNSQPTHSTLDLNKCKKRGQDPPWFIGIDTSTNQQVEEWVANSNGRLVCEPRPTGPAAIASLRASGREYVAAAVERLDAAVAGTARPP